MSNQTIARRYAQALFQLAQDEGKLDVYRQELNQVVLLSSEIPQLNSLLVNRLLPASRKQEVLGQLFAGRLSAHILNFLMLLVAKRRETLVAEISVQYALLVDAANNTLEAHVQTAAEMTDKDRRDLEKKLALATGKQVRLKETVNPGLLGGVVVQIGDRILDGSVVKRLQMLQDNLRNISFS